MFIARTLPQLFSRSVRSDISVVEGTTAHRAPNGAPDFFVCLGYKHLAPNGAKRTTLEVFEEFLTQT